jgi:hypothetical protein
MCQTARCGLKPHRVTFETTRIFACNSLQYDTTSASTIRAQIENKVHLPLIQGPCPLALEHGRSDEWLEDQPPAQARSYTRISGIVYDDNQLRRLT